MEQTRVQPTEPINPFPYFTRFLEERLGSTIFYRHTLDRPSYKTRLYGVALVQEDHYKVFWIYRTRQARFGFPLSTTKRFLGTIENVLEGPANDLDHFDTRTTDYDGKLPIKGRLTLFNRKIRVTEHPETHEADLPVIRKIRQPRFYKEKLPRWIFAYVMSPEEKVPTTKS